VVTDSSPQTPRQFRNCSEAKRQQRLAGLEADGMEPHLRARRVVRRQHAGASGCPLSLSASAQLQQRAASTLDLRRGRPPGRSSIGSSKQPTMVDSTPTATGPPSTIRSMRPDRSLCTWAAVVGRNVTGEVCRWRHHRPAEHAQDFARHGVGRYPDRNGIEARGREIGHGAALSLGQHQRQRAGPERFGERRCGSVKAGDPPCGGDVADMGDQRIEGRPALGLVEVGDCAELAASAPRP